MINWSPLSVASAASSRASWLHTRVAKRTLYSVPRRRRAQLLCPGECHSTGSGLSHLHWPLAVLCMRRSTVVRGFRLASICTVLPNPDSTFRAAFLYSSSYLCRNSTNPKIDSLPAPAMQYVLSHIYASIARAEAKF